MHHIRIPIIVEGKYDKARLSQVVSAPILTTEGFGIFNNAEKKALIRKLGEHGVILLCDSDGGGKVIRSFLKGILAPELVYDLYIPQVAGKERRKRHGSKAGFLGVEGIDNATLTGIFDRLAEKHPEILAEQGSAPAAESASETDAVEKPELSKGEGQLSTGSPISKTDLYFAGLTGGENAADRRDRLCVYLGFPAGMTPNALLAALNILYDKAEFDMLCGKLFPEDENSAGE